jgi:hypothetical protein
MARETARKGARRSGMRSEVMLQRRIRRRFGICAELHYWMAVAKRLFSVALVQARGGEQKPRAHRRSLR